MTILDRYICRTIIITTLFVSLIIIGIDSFLTLMQQVRHVGDNHYTLADALLFVPMQLPAQFYQLFPMAGFLGAMIGLGRLSSSSQLMVMRASGMSVMSILLAVAKAAIIMIIVVTIFGEGFGPWWQQDAALMRQSALFPMQNNVLLKSIWLHQKNDFIHIDTLKNTHDIHHITRYRFSPNGQLQEILFAKQGTQVNHHWQLSDVSHTVFHNTHISVQTQPQKNMHIVFKPKLEVQMNTQAGEQSLWDLYHTILYRDISGLNVHRFVFLFFQRILQPITTLVMICLAVPFILGSFKRSSMGMQMMAGVLMGFLFYMMNQLFGPITLVYEFPPFLAAVIPTCVFLGVGVLWLVLRK